jgi:hypothetical protein
VPEAQVERQKPSNIDASFLRDAYTYKKKSPCAKAGASHVRAFLLVKYHPAVDQQ